MARTLIGQLILRLQTQGLGETKKVEQAMRNVEAAARRLSNTPAPTWGVGFQRQLDRLKLAPQEFDAVRRSWSAMVDDMRRKNLAGALRSTEIANWKNATISQFAAVRGEFDQHMRAVEDRARRHRRILGNIGRGALVAMGAYTGVYAGGLAVRRGLSASAVEERERFRQNMAGIPKEDREAMADYAEAMSIKYPSVPVAEVMEMARYSYSFMGNVERAVAVLETMTQAQVTLQSVKDPNSAVTQLTTMLRGLDNLGVNKDGQLGIEQVVELIGAVVKAAQVDPDVDPAAYFSFARRAKVAGPALSPDFLARAPVFIQDMGSDTAGNSLAMAFKAFVLEAVGSAGGKRYIAERDRLGLRDGKGLIEAELFGSDPDAWVLKRLIPALERDGVNLNNDTAVATAVGKLSGNTNATGLLTRIITQRDQIERWLRLQQEAMGLDAADAARHNDPFVALEAFKSSWANLAAAMGGMPAITSGLNTFADTINNLQQRIRDGDPTVSTAATVAGVGAAGGSAVILARGVYGLITAGTNLNTAAANLNVAAARLGGGSAADAATGKKGGSIFGTPMMLAIGSMLSLSGDTPGNSYLNASGEERAKMREAARQRTAEMNAEKATDGPSAWRRFFLGKAAEPDFSFRKHVEIDAGITREAESIGAADAPDADRKSYDLDTSAASAEAGALGTDLRSLAETVTPNVDTSRIRAAREEAQSLLSLLQRIGDWSSQAAANVGAELRRNFSD